MTRKTKIDPWELFREVRRALRASGMRKPLDRIYKRELPQCGARCRDGHSCQAQATRDAETGCYVRNGRCRLHGGLSTGPRTAAGKRRVGEVARRRAQARRDGTVR